MGVRGFGVGKPSVRLGRGLAAALAFAALAVMVVLLTQALAYLGAHDASLMPRRARTRTSRVARRVSSACSRTKRCSGTSSRACARRRRGLDEAARDAFTHRETRQTAMPVEDRRGTRDKIMYPEDGVRAVERG